MKNLARILLLSATLLTSVSAGPKIPVPQPFIPESMELDLKSMEWASIRLTGQFMIEVKYVSNGKEVTAEYQAVSQNGKWYHEVLRSYELGDLESNSTH